MAKGLINRIPTVTLKDKFGRVQIVNAEKWATDLGLGRYRGWERVTESDMRTGPLVLNSEPQPQGNGAEATQQQQTIQPKDSTIAGAAPAEGPPVKRGPGRLRKSV